MSCDEQWRPVVGWQGYYEVSSRGRVRSLPRTIMRSNGKPQTFKERILRPAPDRNGYLAVTLCRDGVARTVQVHVVEFAAFNGPLPRGMTVDHRDRNETNNDIGNLRLATNQQNAANSKLSTANTSGFKGVSQTASGKWQAQIFVDGKSRYLGSFDNPEQASLAYRREAEAEFGEFANA